MTHNYRCSLGYSNVYELWYDAELYKRTSNACVREFCEEYQQTTTKPDHKTLLVFKPDIPYVFLDGLVRVERRTSYVFFEDGTKEQSGSYVYFVEWWDYDRQSYVGTYENRLPAWLRYSVSAAELVEHNIFYPKLASGSKGESYLKADYINNNILFMHYEPVLHGNHRAKVPDFSQQNPMFKTAPNDQVVFSDRLTTDAKVWVGGSQLHTLCRTMVDNVSHVYESLLLSVLRNAPGVFYSKYGSKDNSKVFMFTRDIRLWKQENDRNGVLVFFAPRAAFRTEQEFVAWSKGELDLYKTSSFNYARLKFDVELALEKEQYYEVFLLLAENSQVLHRNLLTYLFKHSDPVLVDRWLLWLAGDDDQDLETLYYNPEVRTWYEKDLLENNEYEPEQELSKGDLELERLEMLYSDSF